MAFFSIGCFVVIFTIAIIWATRPENKRDAQAHGTAEPSERLTAARHK